MMSKVATFEALFVFIVPSRPDSGSGRLFGLFQLFSRSNRKCDTPDTENGSIRCTYCSVGVEKMPIRSAIVGCCFPSAHCVHRRYSYSVQLPPTLLVVW